MTLAAQVEASVATALEAFAEDVARRHWRGRENEAVNLFALGHLLPKGLAAGWLKDATQLGIEVAVPQVAGTKKQVRKDLVVWPEPAMTCWDEDWAPVRFPVAVLEWKFKRFKGSAKALANSQHDLDWLAAFTRPSPERVGFAIGGVLDDTTLRLSAARVRSGIVRIGWAGIFKELSRGSGSGES